MNVEKGILTSTDKYKFSREDKIRIESQYGMTKIFINDEPLKFVTKLKLVHILEKMPYLEIDRLIPIDEVEETLNNMKKTK